MVGPEHVASPEDRIRIFGRLLNTLVEFAVFAIHEILIAAP